MSVCESALGGIWRLQTGCCTETESGGRELIHIHVCVYKRVLATVVPYTLTGQLRRG